MSSTAGLKALNLKNVWDLVSRLRRMRQLDSRHFPHETSLSPEHSGAIKIIKFDNLDQGIENGNHRDTQWLSMLFLCE